MKKLFFAALALSLSAQAEETKSIVVRDRVLGESVIAVSGCSVPVVSARDYKDFVYNQDGQIRKTSTGTMMTKNMTEVSATSTFSVGRCVLQESYKVEVTSKGMWDKSEVEIANSGVKTALKTQKAVESETSQNIDIEKLLSSTNSGGFFNQKSSLELLETIKQGLINQARNECEMKRAQVAAQIVNISQTACK